MESLHFSMSWESFLKAINELKDLSDELNDEWVFHEKHTIESGAYISKKLYQSYSTTLLHEESNLEECNFIDEAVQTEESSIITYEYHIVYNSSYACPVLCFNAWKTNGNLLTVEECWEKFNLANCVYKYNVLTQMEHPVLMKPFITLHPCKTAELIGAFENSKNIVVSWLSTVGPVVGLNISTDYAKLTF